MCQQNPFDTKEDLPFENDAAIEAMVVEFEACRWPFVRWTHRCHLAAAAWYLRQLPYIAALDKVRDGIQRYNRACGTGDGYNETITQLFLKVVSNRLASRESQAPIGPVVDELARTRTMNWVLDFYSRELLASPAAINGWVEPDRKPLTL
jgi:hypothetical protein